MGRGTLANKRETPRPTIIIIYNNNKKTTTKSPARPAAIPAQAAAPGGECMKPLDADGIHDLVCQVGGLVIRRHHSLRDAFAWIGRQAGYAVRTEVYEPAWTRARTNEQGELEVEQARWDNRFEGPPSDPLIYGDVVVTHPEGSACLRKAADEDGAAVAGAAADKHLSLIHI